MKMDVYLLSTLLFLPVLIQGTSPLDCVDKVLNCQDFLVFCENNDIQRFMKDNCQKSCGLCEKGFHASQKMLVSEPPPEPAPPAPRAASSKCSISVMLGKANANHKSLMLQLCEHGRKNVLVKGLKEDRPANQKATRRAEQFMVLNLHRDSFSATPSYHVGVAKNNGDKYWKVDDTVQLNNGNMWYRNGLPLWPLLHQTIKVKEKSIIGTGSTPDWPNYAIGTPIYLIGNDVANKRDPKVSMSKFFAGEVASTPKFAQSACTGTCIIVEPEKLKKQINTLLTTKFTGKNNAYIADALKINAYSNWAELIVQESLPLMLKSFKKRQKSRCPDELLLFLNQKPCPAASPCPILDAIKQQLKLAECETTEMVVGHLAPTAG